MSFIFSIQFSGSGLILDESFSNTFGSYKRTGKREITATTVDLSFETGDGTFIGVASATYVLKFNREFQTANVTCEGAIFEPGVNPLGDVKKLVETCISDSWSCSRFTP